MVQIKELLDNHYDEKDDTWEDETGRLKFKVEGETLSLVEGNTTYLFTK